MSSAIAFEIAHVFVGGIFVGAGFADRREQQQSRPRSAFQRISGGIAVTRRAVEPRHDHGVELEAFGLVDGHDLDRIRARLPCRAAHRVWRASPRARRDRRVAGVVGAASSSRKISASSRSVASSQHAGPPSASHAPSTRSRRLPRRRCCERGIQHAAHPCRAGLARRHRAARRARRRASLPTPYRARLPPGRQVATGVNPHHGARSTASHAARSAGCASARVSA